MDEIDDSIEKIITKRRKKDIKRTKVPVSLIFTDFANEATDCYDIWLKGDYYGMKKSLNVAKARFRKTIAKGDFEIEDISVVKDALKNSRIISTTKTFAILIMLYIITYYKKFLEKNA